MRRVTRIASSGSARRARVGGGGSMQPSQRLTLSRLQPSPSSSLSPSHGGTPDGYFPFSPKSEEYANE